MLEGRSGFRRLDVKATWPMSRSGAPRPTTRRPLFGSAPAAAAPAAAVQRRRRSPSTAPRQIAAPVGAIRRASPTRLRARPSADSAVVMLVVEADLRAFGFASAGGKLSDVLDLRVLTTELGHERHRALRAQGRDVVPRGDALRAGLLASAVAGVPPEAGTLPGESRGARRQQRPDRQRHRRLRRAAAEGAAADHAHPHRRHRGAVVRVAVAA